MTTNFSISQFKEELTAEGGLTQSCLFEASVTFAESNSQANRLLLDYQQRNLRKFFLCQSARVPGYTIDHSELHYFGRAVKIPGARVYSPITLEFILTNNYVMREMFQTWQSFLSPHEDNARYTDPVYGTVTLKHYSMEGTGSKLVATTPFLNMFSKSRHPVVATYVLHNAFPTEVSAMTYSYNDESVQTFSVTFEYQAMDYLSSNNALQPNRRLILPTPTKSEVPSNGHH